MLFKFNWMYIIGVILAICMGCSDEIDGPRIPDPTPTPSPSDTVFYKGVDLSFQPEAQDWNTQYYDQNGIPVEVLPYFAQQGVNLVRLRLWYNPASGYCDLEHTLNFAEKVKQNGMEVLLCLHYSDTWADPGNQETPSAWVGLDFEVLNDSVSAYTSRVVNAFKARDIMPAIIQIGNETNSGFLWDQGRVGGDYEDNWNNYIGLVNSAVKAIRDNDTAGKVRIMMHFAGLNGADWFFGNLAQYGVDYNYIGLSFYAIWHGKSLNQLKIDMAALSETYNRKVMIVETVYPWTLEWNDWTNNTWGLEDQLMPGYEATPEGQKNYLDDLRNMIEHLDRGLGFCYWSPDWVAFKGSEASDGSTMENAALFDFENKALPAVEVFNP